MGVAKHRRSKSGWSLALMPLLASGAALGAWADEAAGDRPPSPQPARVAACVKQCPRECPKQCEEQCDEQCPQPCDERPSTVSPSVATTVVPAELNPGAARMRQYFTDQLPQAAPAPVALAGPQVAKPSPLAESVEPPPRLIEIDENDTSAPAVLALNDDPPPATVVELSRLAVGSALLPEIPPAQRMRLAANSNSNSIASANPQVVESTTPDVAQPPVEPTRDAWGATRSETLPAGPAVVKLQGGETITLESTDDCQQARVKNEEICAITHLEAHRLVITGLSKGSTHVSLSLKRDGRMREQTLIVQVESTASRVDAAALQQTSHAASAESIPASDAPRNQLRVAPQVRRTSHSAGDLPAGSR